MSADFDGPTDEAFGLIDMPSIPVYEKYRWRLAEDPEQKANVAPPKSVRRCIEIGATVH